MDENLRIYSNNYTKDNMNINKQFKYKYDSEMINISQEYVKKYGKGRDVLDLCCGTGEYTVSNLELYKTITCIDFSRNLLNVLRERVANKLNIKIIEADARDLSMIQADSFDFVFSWCSLYYVPNVNKAVSEIARVLKHEGYAALEFGNQKSLARIISEYHYRSSGWAKPECISVKKIIEYCRDNNLEIIEHRAFQFLPMLKLPPKYFITYPIIAPTWKYFLGIKIGKKMIDEWISSNKLFKKYSFRHLLLVRKV